MDSGVERSLSLELGNGCPRPRAEVISGNYPALGKTDSRKANTATLQVKIPALSTHTSKITREIEMFNKDKKAISVLPEAGKEVTPMVMLQMAEAQGAPVEQLERLWALNEKVEAANAKKAYTVAMSSFRAECPTITRTKKAHNSNYAGLAETIDEIKDLLAECGLSHSWKTDQENGRISVTCCVTHVQGHKECTKLEEAADKSGSKNDIQAIGSTVSYLQRYTLFSILGLASKEADNDGNDRVSFEQAEELETLADEAGVDKGKFLTYFQCGSFNHIPAKQYKNALSAIKKKKESKK